MTTKHTPGPWRVLRPGPGIDYNWHVTDEMDTFVAHVFGFSHAVDEQSRINASLIAAAPDLLDALIELNSVSARGFLYDDPARVKARAAIAKATGSQS